MDDTSVDSRGVAWQGPTRQFFSLLTDKRSAATARVLSPPFPLSSQTLACANPIPVIVNPSWDVKLDELQHRSWAVERRWLALPIAHPVPQRVVQLRARRDLPLRDEGGPPGKYIKLTGFGNVSL